MCCGHGESTVAPGMGTSPSAHHSFYYLFKLWLIGWGQHALWIQGSSLLASYDHAVFADAYKETQSCISSSG